MAGGLSLTFLGHQGWLAQTGAASIAFDPVFEETFGHSPGTEFRIFPARRLAFERLPYLDALFLSHEHLDHFHIPSLARLDRSTPVYLSPLMPACVCEALTDLGFTVARLTPALPVAVQDLRVTAFTVGAGTVPWESRVGSFLIEQETSGLSAFNAVDAVISDQMAAMVSAGSVRPPDLVIVANNSQIVPPGGYGAQTNLLPIPDEEDDIHPGLNLLSNIFLEYLRALPKPPCVALCGNGFVNMKKPYGPFLYSDNAQLAAIVNALSTRPFVVGPVAGDVIQLRAGGLFPEISRCDFVELDQSLNVALLERRQRFLERPVPDEFCELCPQRDLTNSEMLTAIRTALDEVATALLLSPTGACLIETVDHLCGALGPLRAVFRFTAREGTYHLAFDVVENRFVEVTVTTPDQLLTCFPMGVEVPLSDFYAVVSGEVQIWDVAATNLRGWYVGSKYENLTSFLFTAFGEHARPDLALKVYRSAIARLPS